MKRRRRPKKFTWRNKSSRNMSDPAYAKFRKEVRRRDGNKCQWPSCGSKKNLQVHHIRKWSDFPSLRFDVLNGITLCKRCHQIVTGNEEIYSEFLIKLIEHQALRKLKEKKKEDE